MGAVLPAPWESTCHVAPVVVVNVLSVEAPRQHVVHLRHGVTRNVAFRAGGGAYDNDLFIHRDRVVPRQIDEARDGRENPAALPAPGGGRWVVPSVD